MLQASTQGTASRNSYYDHSASQFSDSAFPRSSGGRPPQGGFRDYKSFPKTHPQPAPGYQAHPSSASTHETFSKQSSRTDSGGLGAYPWEARHQSVRGLDLSSSNAVLLGTLVCLRNNPGRKGFIRWIGNLPNYLRGVIAGIELVSVFVILYV